jgi:pyruvate/2-oxoglutarate dehydrogenase complex dihydrolipoamide acyltransferase (E2) component
MLNILEVRVPKMGMDTTEVTIASWLVNKGDVVQKGAPLVELESEKTLFVLESEADGEITEIVHPQGSTIAVGEVICFLKNQQ